MKGITFFACLIALIPVFTSAQIYTSGNGLTTTGSSGTNVKLGGILSENTTIDLGPAYKFTFTKSTAEFFSITNNGNIGINHSNPLAKLHIVGDGNSTSSSAFLIANSDNSELLRVYDNGHTNINGTLYAAASTAGLHFSTGAGDNEPTLSLLRTGSSGWQKINLADVNGTVQGGLWTNGDGEIRHYASWGGWWPTFWSNGAEAMRLSVDRNLLIGTTSDNGYKLDVAGSTRVTGPITFSGLANDDTRTRVLVSDINGNLAYRNATSLGGGSGASNWTNTGSNIYYNSGNVGIGGPGDQADARLQVSGRAIFGQNYLGDPYGTYVRLSGHSNFSEVNVQSQTGGDLTMYANPQSTDQTGYTGKTIYANSNGILSGGYPNSTDFNIGSYNNIIFRVGSTGTEIVRVSRAGNMLVGTASDIGYKLDVAGSTRVTGPITFSGLANDDTRTRVLVSDMNGNLAYRDATSLGGGSAGSNWTNTGADIYYNSGSVGIGAPADNSYKLDVNGKTRVQLSMLIGSLAITKDEDAYMLGVATGIRMDGDYAPMRFQTSPQGHVVDNFVFESVYGNPREIYHNNSSIIRIKQGWGAANTHGYNLATIRIDNEINNYNSSEYILRGIYYNPLITNLGPATHIAFENTSGTNHFNSTSGNSVVGSSSDNGEKLQVNGNIWATGLMLPTGAATGKVLTSDANGNASWQALGAGGSGTTGWAIGGNAVTTLKTLGTIDNYDLPFITNNTERMRIGANGNIGIGTISINESGYKLFVETGIRTRKVKVDQSGWADYVFDESYKLRSLTEVEKFIQQNHHLPEVPSAAEVGKNGLDLGDNQATLLKKIEELTLYIIDMNKKLEAHEKKIEVLEKRKSDRY